MVYPFGACRCPWCGREPPSCDASLLSPCSERVSAALTLQFLLFILCLSWRRRRVLNGHSPLSIPRNFQCQLDLPTPHLRAGNLTSEEWVVFLWVLGA